MQATLPYRKSKKIASQRPVFARPPAPLNSAVAEEIFSFIAMRDLLLAEAEEHPTEASLHRVWMANEFAERCLEPARAPYQEQSLPEAEAVFERRRCKDVKTRLAQLRTRVHSEAA